MSTLKELSKKDLNERLSVSLADLKNSEKKTELQRLAHDLQTHQIELEMQNRELCEAQQKLEEARDKYADLYDFAPISYITFDEKGVVRNINLTGAAMLGQVRARIIGQPFMKWIAKEDLTLFYHHVRVTLQSDLQRTNELKVRGEQGKTFDVRIDSLRHRDISNSTYVCRSTMLDITETNRIKTEVFLQARQLKLITDALPVLIAYINTNKQHLFANKAYADWFGYSPTEIIGKHASEVWGETDYKSIYQHFTHSLAGMPVNFDLEVPVEGKDRKFINAIFIPDYGSGGQVYGVIALIGDITDRLVIEAIDRKRLLDVAHFSRLCAMGEMTSEIAHELNQPLAAISIYSDACRRMLISGTAEQDKIIRTLVDIGEQAERAGKVIRRIREFVGRKEINKIDIAINELINDALHLLAVEIRSHKVKLNLDLDDDLPMIFADKILIEQVIINLVRNALDTMNEIKEPKRILTISTSPGRLNEIKVSVIDSGPGMSVESANRLFQPFHTTKAHGMGLGLTISRSIIEAHHGRLWGDASGPAGVVFSFTLPCN